jgi:hypothetical protein
MRRRLFLAAGAAMAAIPALARAQTEEAGAQEAGAAAPGARIALSPIEPENALEYAFVSALDNANMRAVFRRYLLDTHVVLATAGEGADAAPREVQLHTGSTAVPIFTSANRINTVFGEDAPRIILNGRAALERVRDKNVVINFQLIPMLTLEPEDISRYLETPGETSAGPAQ